MRKSETLDEMLDQAYATVERAKEREELLHAMAEMLDMALLDLPLIVQEGGEWVKPRSKAASLLSRYRALRGKEGA
jgi:hypothetical protein